MKKSCELYTFIFWTNVDFVNQNHLSYAHLRLSYLILGKKAPNIKAKKKRKH